MAALVQVVKTLAYFTENTNCAVLFVISVGLLKVQRLLPIARTGIFPPGATSEWRSQAELTLHPLNKLLSDNQREI